MNARISPAAAAALALARSGAHPGELVHVAPRAPIRDIDRGRYFTWHRGGVVRAWADPASRTTWVFALRDHWCAVQGVFVAPA